MLLKNFLFATIVFCATQTIYGQDYYFRHYQVENGLSNNAVVCSVQDSKGFMWFGTKDGLNRFDGYSFKIFRSNPHDSASIGSNFIHCLFTDRQGTLWVGTERGLYKYNSITESFGIVQGTWNNPIRDVNMDVKGMLWFISGFTLAKYTESVHALQYYPAAQYGEATSLCTTPDGTLWIATVSGVLKKYTAAGDAFTSYAVFAHLPENISRWIEKIQGASNGSILIGTSNLGAKLFDVRTEACTDILTYRQHKTKMFVRNFLQASPDEYWIATESGIFIYNIKKKILTHLQKKYNDPYAISDNAVYSFCKDREGGIWSGTYFGGVNYYPRQYTPFKKFFPRIGSNSLSGNVVREIHPDALGNIWIGTEDAGLNKFNAATQRFTHYLPTGVKGSISYSNIHGMLITGNELWIGTFEHGLDVFDLKTEKVIRHYEAAAGRDALKSNFIYCMYATAAGEIMLGTTIGAYLYNRGSNHFSNLPGMPQNNWYTSIIKDDQGIVWAATYGNGVNFYHTKTHTGGNYSYNAQNNNSLSNDRVNSIFEDSDKNLWFATEGGLCRLNRAAGNFTRYTTANGFPSNFMLSILEDEKKNLWISTSRGLVCFNAKTNRLKTYTVATGILNDQFNFSSAYKDPQGRMYFGSVKGMISFMPAAFVQNTFIPPVYITGFQVFNKDLTITPHQSPLSKSITFTNKITLAHDQSTFSIDFAALSYTAPETSEYAYTMAGLDSKWTYLKSNRKVYFTKLLPGSYVFTVKAANSSSAWNQAPAKLLVNILPPWWAGWWAYTCYVLLAVLLIYVTISNYHKKTEEKNRRKLELMRVVKEKEMFQAKIDFFTNIAHEIKTPLTLIKGPLEKVMKKTAGNMDIKNSLKIMERNTNRLINLTNELLDFRQTEIKGFSLNFVAANISALLEETYTNFKPLAELNNLTYTMDLPPTPLHASVDVESFIKIISNLFSNAVKYARHTVSVSLLFSAQNNTFTVEIRNDGYVIPYQMKEKIFEPFFRLKETEKQKGAGIGLALSRSLAQLHKGVLDLKEPENELNTFFLTLAIHQENECRPYHEKPESTPVTAVNND